MNDPFLFASRYLFQQRNASAWESVRVAPGQLAATAGTLYTAPAKTTPVGSVATAFLTSIVLCNTDSAARTVTIYLVESGGTAAANRAILSAYSINANTTYIFDCGEYGIPLADSETIQGLADTASKVTYRISVKERT